MSLIEREPEIDLCLTALAAQEHVLFVGAPGTAKSLVADTIAHWMGSNAFTVTLNKDTARDALFGPIKLSALKADRYERATDGTLADCYIAVLNEIFKTGPAVLDMTLDVLNERQYREGVIRRPCNLRMAVAASNEWQPEGFEASTQALFDRFVLRKYVDRVRARDGVERLWSDENHTPQLSTTISPDEIDLAHAQAMAIPWSEEAHDARRTILMELAKEGILPGDRRQKKAYKVAKAFAYVCGSGSVTPEHLEVLAYVLWDDPREQPQKTAQIVAKVANPTAMMVNSLLVETEQVLAAADARDLAKAATATKKLGEIVKSLKGMAATGNGRVAKAVAYVEGQARKLRQASMETI